MTEMSQSIVPTYAPPSSRIPSPAARFLRYYAVYLFITAIPNLICVVVMLGVAPVFQNIFRDFKTTLPAITEWLFDLSDFGRSGGWILPVLAALGIAFLPTVITARIPERVHRVTCILIYLILVLMFILLEASITAMALFLPLVKLIQSVSGGGGGGGP